MNAVNKTTLSSIGHLARSHGVCHDILSGTVTGKQKRDLGKGLRKLTKK